MNYATEKDIRRYLGAYAVGWPRADQSPPTILDGLAFAAQASGDIDAVLSAQGLAVPIAGPQPFVDHLRDMAAMYAAAFITAGLFPQAQGPASTTLSGFLMSAYNAGLAALRAGEGLPLGAAQDPSAMPRAFWTSHPDSNSADLAGTPGNEIDPVFTRDIQW